ncbi:MAG TPA: pyridoxamine 5'-phosphate oxidase family protein [bacterium]|nr:pyridoxamine 5'-phosphate oxidase family protein [bacterium]
MRIPSQVKKLFEQQALVAFATAGSDGNPNVVPIYWKTILDDETILLLDNYMNMSKDNLSANAYVCISVWDPETEEAYKLKGTATYHTAGPVFESGKQVMQAKKPDRAPRGVVAVAVMEIYTIKPGPEAGSRL